MIKMWADIVLAPSWCSHLIPTPLCETYSCLHGGEAHRFLILWGETKALIHSTVTQEGGFCTYQSKNVVWPRDPIIKLKRQEKAPFTLGPFIHSRARLCISLHMNKVSGLFYREMHQARGFNDKIMSRRGCYFFFAEGLCYRKQSNLAVCFWGKTWQCRSVLLWKVASHMHRTNFYLIYQSSQTALPLSPGEFMEDV